MKKFLAMLLIFAMLISFSAYAKSYSSDVLYSLGYLPEELKNKGQETVYRDEFAAVCAAVMGLSGLEPIDTPFTDVKADNPYSGAIMALLNSKIMYFELKYRSNMPQNVFWLPSLIRHSRSNLYKSSFDFCCSLHNAKSSEKTFSNNFLQSTSYDLAIGFPA